ncbi:hypothetical protein SD71_16225 [Cohnella kolymensis]|uniref:Lipid/polyisoprenoid-binding YceI-like domain-containing protein n=1 Tax=Cohnella kolymensis TaxID=1590652 RepID=A0ABR5A3Q3_9BACL|nr:hypothetical protein [Cohnella kolymensis]KIL35170.1 hypothetical protein SD71_16225 [Cohnella kolymensis]
MPGQELQLSGAIVAFAGAAKVAQKLMSDGEDPMTIREYTFTANLATDITINNQLDVGLNISRLTLKDKLTIDYKEHWGLEVKCTIVPSASLAQTAQGG